MPDGDDPIDQQLEAVDAELREVDSELSALRQTSGEPDDPLEATAALIASRSGGPGSPEEREQRIKDLTERSKTLHDRYNALMTSLVGRRMLDDRSKVTTAPPAPDPWKSLAPDLSQAAPDPSEPVPPSIDLVPDQREGPPPEDVTLISADVSGRFNGPDPPRPADDAPPVGGGNRGRFIGIAIAVAVVLLVVVAMLVASGRSSKKTDAVATQPASSDSEQPTVGGVPSAAVVFATQEPCNTKCYQDSAANCDRTFHYVFDVLGDDVSKFEGKQAVLTSTGPGTEPTYTAPVVGGKITIDIVIPASAYGGKPAPPEAFAQAGCGGNGTWAVRVQSIDGVPANPGAAAN